MFKKFKKSPNSLNFVKMILLMSEKRATFLTTADYWQHFKSHCMGGYGVLITKTFELKILIIFLIISLNMWFGCLMSAHNLCCSFEIRKIILN